MPPIYVTGSISLVNATFARFLTEEMPAHPVVPTALAGWNKVLALHQHMMHLGYQASLALDSGDFPLQFALFGRMRTITGTQELTMHLPAGADAQLALRKFFNYFPQARSEVFDVEWQPGEQVDARGTPVVYGQARLRRQADVARAAQRQGSQLHRRPHRACL